MQLKIRVNDLNLKISETGSSFILLLSAWLILSLSAMILSCPEFLFAYTENVYTDYTEVSGDITGQNIEWTKAKSPYVVSGDIYVYGGTDVSNVATLTIEKGVVVRFKSGTTLYAGSASSTRHWGAIFAQGTASEPIIFTSNESVPSPGDWRGIYFRNDTDGNSTLLEHCIIEYGGYLTTSNIYCYSVSPTIRNCEIHKSSAHGIYLNNASPVITDNIIKNNVLDGIYGNDLSKPQINGNDFRDTDNDGIRQRYAVNIYPNGVSNMGDNIGSGIDGEYINIRAGNITSDITWNALSADALPYVVAGHIYVYGGTDVSNVATLTIEKGVVVRFKSGTTLYAGSASSTRHWGAIFAQGTASEPIIFTSNEAVPSPGDWKGIYFRNDTDGNSTLLEHCIIEYGGYLTTSNVYCYSVSPTIRNCEIHKSSVHGIYLNNASPVITDNIIKNNVLDGIYGNDLSKPQINGNDFRDTDNDGIRQRYAVNIYPNGVTTMGDNIGSGIDGEYINIRAGNITSDITWNALSADALPYVVAGNIYVYGGTDV
ncbi:MAG: right-handed parallel beta-helix repeat-containing protein, partial [Desulfobacteraceae bacterium]|nr:right-handed parallel beta-helix repeat-containing protein [Desulfobacteraceae bacterium]MBC2756882.1 right-handed parallel beta-helix repeat-containing protein [Desulfobacteraceae bacterium]